ncbi:putative transposase [Parafrankia sp. EAN1pec]|uniref:integrase core domain-containing protein n=1 Tax=Parafrankia sp. (strain EAN1pec) TaxID=298653 RepID=UPI000054150C|nr:putative transposase [Frankia sp. EAN1pec]
MALGERAARFRFLIRDRDTKFTAAFDTVFTTDNIDIVRTPARAPVANAFAERWVGTIRRECLDHLLILGERHLTAVLTAYVDHYNQHRPHQSLQQQAPLSAGADPPPEPGTPVVRHGRLGGLIYEYQQAA